MNFWYLKLDYSASERPGDAKAYIRLAGSGTDVAPQVKGSAELDAQIDQMHSELEEIRATGRALFANSKAAWSAAGKSN